MQYEDALRLWGATKLASRYNVPLNELDPDLVKIEMIFDEGYQCCGGRDPDCYCSFAESPSADVLITYRGTAGPIDRQSAYRISSYDFNFVDILGEIVAAGGGTLTSEGK